MAYCIACDCDCAPNDEPVMDTKYGPMCKACREADLYRCDDCGYFFDEYQMARLGDQGFCPACRSIEFGAVE